jgi:group II intron reverse transcriptase/maturase
VTGEFSKNIVIMKNNKIKLRGVSHLAQYDNLQDPTLLNKQDPIFKIHKTDADKDVTSRIRGLLEFDKKGLCTNAFQILSDPVTLRDAYETIKNKSGNMVPGTDKETLDGIGGEWFHNTSKKLLNESFQPRPSRRVLIPKANGKMRPLGISSPRDKIVQQSMRIVMEMILEPKFKESSHGFRPKKGCHTALQEVRAWNGVTWFLEGDIKSFFDSIDHFVLAKLLEKHFKEARLLHLYWKLVKAGYIEWNSEKREVIASDIGVPQGGIISPLLSNVVLHELDVYMENLINKRKELNCMNKGLLPNLEYTKLSARITRVNKKIALGTDTKEDRDWKKWNLKERRKIPSQKPNPIVKRIEYVRYADDWLVGIWGEKNDAKLLKEQIRVFLKDLKLELSIEKTLITNARSDRAKFLGVLIKRIASNKGLTSIRDENGLSKRIPSGNTWMTAPIPEIIKRLINRKFANLVKDRWDPISIPQLIPLPIKDIILRFKTVLAGFLNYFSFVDNRKKLLKVYWVLKESLRKTICRKLDIGKKTFLRQFGPQTILKIRKSDGTTVELDFKCPGLSALRSDFRGTRKFNDPLQVKNWGISTIAALGQPCANCGSDEKIEMHHVKHLKTLNVKLSPFDQMMARINRKQVPLCPPCHRKVHRGTYQGMSLKYFQHIKWWGEGKWT